MVDLGPVLTAATEYGDAREAEGRAAAEAEAAVKLGQVLADLDTTTAALAALRAEYDAHMATHEPVPVPVALTSIGMSSPRSLWPQRLAEVGPDGVTSQRIYCDVTASGISSNLDRITTALAEGRTPVVSLKPSDRNIDAWGSSARDSWVTAAADQLQALGGRILVADWHEPSDDMTGPEYLDIQRRHLPILGERPNLETYCINHGWLLDRQVPKFAEYLPLELVDLVDYAGIDTYQSGTMASPGPSEPHHRIAALVDYLTRLGRPDKPVIIGEYSAYTAAALARAGDAILATPNVRYALLFNSDQGGKGEPLVPGTERMAAFRATKADDRAKQ
jgi:hypothetical protein